MMDDNKTEFNTGGGSYVLNNVALQMYGEHMHSKEYCRADLMSFAEDVHMGECLRALNVSAYDTRDIDPKSDYFHSEHFHTLEPTASFTYRKGSWGKGDWYVRYTRPYDLQEGLKCCSPFSISFHYLRRERRGSSHTCD